MGKWIVEQPNGLWAIWSTVVDNFVWENLNQVGAFKAFLYDDFPIDQAWKAVHQFPETPKPKRKKDWDERIDLVRRIHGAEEAQEIVTRLSDDSLSLLIGDVAVYKRLGQEDG